MSAARDVMAALTEREQIELLGALRQETEYLRRAWERRNRIYLSLMAYQRPLLKQRAPYRAIVATRRAGKSHGSVAWLTDKMLARAGANCFYLALTRSAARRIAWPVFKAQFRTHGIKADFKESDLSIELENGSKTYLYGVNQENVLDNLRGVPIDGVVLDEAGSFRGSIVETLVDEVLDAAFADYNGELLMIGTPTPVLAGLFYEATADDPNDRKRKEFDVFRWDLRNNSHLAGSYPGGIKAWLRDYLKRKGWPEDNPKFQREFCGRWVPGDDMQVFKFSAARNKVGGFPANLTHHVMGLDLGFRDDTAWSVLGFNPKASRAVYVVDQKNRPGLSISDVAEMTRQLYERWKPYIIVVDPGAGGAQLVPDLVERYGLPVVAAEKVNKRAGIELVNDALLDGSFKIACEGGLAAEWTNLVWRDKEKKAEDPRLPNHLSDATLYAYRECFAFLHSPGRKFASAEDAARAKEDEEMEALESEMKAEDRAVGQSAGNGGWDEWGNW